MEPINNEKLINNESKQLFNKIKSKYILQIVFNFIKKNLSLEIIKKNKQIQKRIGINLNNYKEYSEKYSTIEIEVIPVQEKYGKFINIQQGDNKYYHIYLNNDKNEIKRAYISLKDYIVSKIKIIINYQVNLIKGLFLECEYIESIYFKKFYRNITDMSQMFYGCASLKELDLSNFYTNKVTNMSFMFKDCSSSKELNLSNFNTNYVTNMSSMFDGCLSLKELNLSNFNTNEVTNMSFMFRRCSSIKELNLSNFNTNKVSHMFSMFNECYSLKELNLSNFNTSNVTDMFFMFSYCSIELKTKIYNSYNNFEICAFIDNSLY